MNEPERQPTCAERVQDAWASRRDDLRAMLDPSYYDLTIETFDTTLQDFNICLGEYSVFTLCRDDLQGYINVPLGKLPHDPANRDQWDEAVLEDVLEVIFDDYESDIREAGYEAFNEYGLAFDYVEPGTFEDQEQGYFRYQISWGGPSEEIRFYVGIDYQPYKIEFWYLDWFDGAHTLVTHDEVAQLVWHQFEDFAEPIRERARE